MCIYIYVYISIKRVSSSWRRVRVNMVSTLGPRNVLHSYFGASVDMIQVPGHLGFKKVLFCSKNLLAPESDFQDPDTQDLPEPHKNVE